MGLLQGEGVGLEPCQGFSHSGVHGCDGVGLQWDLGITISNKFLVMLFLPLMDPLKNPRLS